MRGHQPLVAMRLRGVRPPLARVETDPMPWADWADWPAWSDVPMVEVEPRDALHRLDLRCFVAMPVAVGGRDSQRVAAVFTALQAAGASRVIAMVDDGYDTRVVDSLESPQWPA